MPGMPVKRKLLKDIKRQGGFTAVLERIANGESVGKVATTFGVSRGMMIKVLTDNGADKSAFDEARRLSAEAHVEKATDIADHVKANRDDIFKARLQIGHLQWLASKLDRDTWGETPTPAVQVTINTLHLDALRAAPPARIPLPSPTPVEVLNAGET